MRRQNKRATRMVTGAAIALGMLIAGGVAFGQQPGPGQGPGAPFGRRGGMIQGSIVQKDLQNNAVLVRANDGQQQWVQLMQGVSIRKVVPAKLEEIKAKDSVTVTGTPAAITAATCTLDTPAPQAGGGAAGAGVPGGAPGANPPGLAAGRVATQPARVIGTVESVDLEKKQFVLVTPENAKVVVSVPENARVNRLAQLGVNDVALGERFMAMGQPQQIGDVTIIQARLAFAGDLEGLRDLMGLGVMGRFMGGGFFGGDQERFGGRRFGGEGGGQPDRNRPRPERIEQ